MRTSEVPGSCRAGEPSRPVPTAEVRPTTSFHQGERCFPAGDRRQEELAVELGLGNRLEGIRRHRLAAQKPDRGMRVEQNARQRGQPSARFFGAVFRREARRT